MKLFVESPWIEGATEVISSAEGSRGGRALIDLPNDVLPGSSFRLRVSFVKADALKVKCISGKIVHQGTQSTTVTVAVGESFCVEGYAFALSYLNGEQDLLMSVQPGPAVSVSQNSIADVSKTGVSITFWSWCVALLVVVAGFVTPLFSTVDATVAGPYADNAPAWLPGAESWSPGPLHEAHITAGLEGECTACHAEAFEVIEDRECLVCHGQVNEHVEITPVNQPHFIGQACADCHLDHVEPSVLVNKDPMMCLECHGDDLSWAPDAARITSGFLEGHPPFKVSLWRYQQTAQGSGTWRVEKETMTKDQLLVESSNLTFPHDIHLSSKRMLELNDGQSLECVDCHSIDPGNGAVAPIVMETHCEQCHSLQYDVENTEVSVPHGPVRPVVAELQAQATRKDWGQQRLSRSAWLDKELAHQFGDSGCGLCHTVNDNKSAVIEERWSIQPVHLSDDWFVDARFNHAAHMNIPGINSESNSCRGCHAADQSSQSADVLMPEKMVCESCHNAERGNSAEACIGCHDFHAKFGTPVAEYRLPPGKLKFPEPVAEERH